MTEEDYPLHDCMDGRSRHRGIAEVHRAHTVNCSDSARGVMVPMMMMCMPPCPPDTVNCSDAARGVMVPMMTEVHAPAAPHGAPHGISGQISIHACKFEHRVSQTHQLFLRHCRRWPSSNRSDCSCHPVSVGLRADTGTETRHHGRLLLLLQRPSFQ